MPSLDTNVLVRWLVADDAKQTASAEKVIRQALTLGEVLYVPVTVLLELEWVLRTAYGFPKPSIVSTVVALLETRELQLQSEAAVERALYLFRNTSADFADCLHLGLTAAAAQPPLLTFDRKASRLPGAELLHST